MAGDPFAMRINECTAKYPCFDPGDPHKHIQIVYIRYDTFDDVVFDTRIYKDCPQDDKETDLSAAAFMLMQFHINDAEMGGPFVKKMDPRDIYKGPRKTHG